MYSIKFTLLFIFIFTLLIGCSVKQDWEGLYYYSADQEVAGRTRLTKTFSEVYNFSSKEECINWGEDKLKDENIIQYICRYDCEEVRSEGYDLGAKTADVVGYDCKEQIIKP